MRASSPHGRSPGSRVSPNQARRSSASQVRPSGAPRLRGIPEASIARLPLYLRALQTMADRGVTTVSSQRACRGVGGQLGKAAQGPVAPWFVRHPRRRLRGGLPRLPDLARARTHPGLGGRHHRRRQPRSGPRELRRLCHSRVSAPRASSTPTLARWGSRSAGWSSGISTTSRQLIVEHGIAIGVLTTPAGAAQQVADRLVAAGIQERAELRSGGVDRSARRRVAQGRPLDRVADPRVPRTATCDRATGVSA